MAKATAVEDMRDVDPVAYIRATGLRPEDSYGFLPIDLHEGTSYFFFYRDRPEYEKARPALPGAEPVRDFGGLAEFAGAGGPAETSMDISDMGKLGEGLGGIVEQAQQMQQQWGAQGVPGGPQESEADRIAGIDRLKEMGAINEQEYKQLVSEVKGGDAGPTPGGAPAAKAAKGAPDIVVHRVYPGMRMRSSTKQLDDFMPEYRDALGLCPEDVYGVYPRGTRTSHGGADQSSTTEWDDFWIVYRDRDEYAAGREAWGKEMNKKGKWPEAETYPGVAGPGKAAFDEAAVEVEKKRWPREKMVMCKQGTDLGDDLRAKIAKWGYEPEDSFGFCPDFDNSAIYFAWRKP